MTGFTLYETLRILVPGGIAAGVLDIILRLIAGRDGVAADGWSRRIVEELETPGAFAATTIAAGLMLYLVDFPSKLRVQRGDPPGWRLPSDHLGDQLASPHLKSVALNIFFLISDRHLPEQTSKRAYLWGSFFRVFVDTRVILMIGIIVGPAAGMAAAPHEEILRLDDTAMWAVVATLAAPLALTVYAGRVHAVNQSRQSAVRRPLRELTHDLRSVSLLALALMSITAAGHWLVFLGGPLAGIGVALLLTAIIGWFGVEIGPPVTCEWRFGWRSAAFARLGAVSNRVQFSSVQRLTCDLAMYVPTVIAASAGDAFYGRHPAGVALWSLLIVPTSAIAAVRKHEIRLLMTYEEQSIWLDLHSRDVARLNSTGELPDRWTDDV